MERQKTKVGRSLCRSMFVPMAGASHCSGLMLPRTLWGLGARPEGGREVSKFECRVFYWLSTGSSVRESLAWQCIPEAPPWPWCSSVTSMPRTQPCDKELRVSQQLLLQTQLPAWLTRAADVAEGRAEGGGGAGGSSYTGCISQHHQDNVTVMACHGAWVILSPVGMWSTSRAAWVMHTNSRDLMGSAKTRAPCCCEWMESKGWQFINPELFTACNLPWAVNLIFIYLKLISF